jgi:pimeloyl-ACP methyl ester carboxylesterase
MRRVIVVLAVVLAFAPSAAHAQSAPPVAFTATYQAQNAWWPWVVMPDGRWVNEACNATTPMTGHEPATGSGYPVLIYLHGFLSEQGSLATGKVITEQAARRGFVAVAPKYDSFATMTAAGVETHADCIFDGGTKMDTRSVVDAACARPKADCSKGVVVAGHSQGGAIAGRARNFSPLVRAAWFLGVSGPNVPEARATPSGTRALPNDRVRFTTGISDVWSWALQPAGPDYRDLDALTGRSCTTNDCIAADGSGFYVVQHSEVTDGYADHCYMEINDYVCQTNPTPDPRWVTGAGKGSLPAGLDWLKRFTG